MTPVGAPCSREIGGDRRRSADEADSQEVVSEIQSLLEALAFIDINPEGVSAIPSR